MQTILNARYLNASDNLRAKTRSAVRCLLLINGYLEEAYLGPRTDNAHCKVQYKMIVKGELVDTVLVVPFGNVILSEETRARLEAAEIAHIDDVAARIVARGRGGRRRGVGGQFARGEARR